MEEIFGAVALDYFGAGLNIIPTTGEDGKRPCENGWNRYAEKRVHSKTLKRWIRDRPTDNIGLMAGPVSGVTVVDIDDPALVGTLIKELGDTPLKASTPGGGTHLYYRHNGERTCNRVEEAAFDVRGRGGAPLLIMPPSLRPDTGKHYQWSEGTLADLQRLPTVLPGTLPVNDNAKSPASGRIPEGNRNNTLFAALRARAFHVDSLEELILFGKGWAEANCLTALLDSEIEKTARQVWRWREDGRLWPGGESNIVITASDLEQFSDGDPLHLWLTLRKNHEGTHPVFRVVAEAMARDGVIQGWGIKRYRSALRTLLEMGLVIRVHKGGSKRGDYSTYTFPN
tara:strand:+ start:25 stop:1047 length:1023 start_codon:yes stop_codon:yes gene_type:complete